MNYPVCSKQQLVVIKNLKKNICNRKQTHYYYFLGTNKRTYEKRQSLFGISRFKSRNYILWLIYQIRSYIFYIVKLLY